jgi:glycosyltransferase involved in cell wall biosynthesis
VRILQISHAFPPTFGGVESHVHDLARGLAARGHEVTCLVGGDGEQDAGQGADPIRVVRHPAIRVQDLLAVERQGPEAVSRARGQVARVLRGIFDAHKPDVVHVHNAHHFSGLLAEAVLGEASATPVVDTVHDRVGEYLRPEVLNLPWAHVLYASHYLLEALPTRCHHSVLWLGIDLTRFTPEGPSDPRLATLPKPVLFHPARLLRWKGIHVSIAALALLRQAGVPASLVLCGSSEIVDDQDELRAYRQELGQLADRLSVSDQVHFEIFERDRMHEAYRASDLVWYPTVDPEPFGLVPLEAMATGSVIVASDSGGIRETVDDGRTGFRVPAGDASALAAASLLVLRDPELRDIIIREAVRHSEQFGLDCYLDALEHLYESLVA